MPDDHAAGRGDRPLSLHQLVRTRMEEHGWSYTDLERRSDHALSRGRWQQLGSGARQKKFPDPATLVIIGRVLDVDITTVVLSAAQTVGLDSRLQGSELAHLLPAGTERLSARTRDAILTLIRAAVADIHATPDTTGTDRLGGVTLEWPKSAAPSRLAEGSTDTGS